MRSKYQVLKKERRARRRAIGAAMKEQRKRVTVWAKALFAYARSHEL